MNNHAYAGIAIPPRRVAPLCRLLGCAADDLLDALASLDDDAPGYLRHASGARVRLAVAVPFRDGITWRVVGIERPAVPATLPALAPTRSPQPALLTLADRLGPYRTIMELG